MLGVLVSWPTVLCAAVAASCLTLSAVQLVVWLKSGDARASLGFSVMALGAAGFTWAELAMMRASAPEPFADALWWASSTVFVMVVGLVVFVRSYFRTARPWLGHLAWILRLVVVLVNFIRAPSVVYTRIDAMQPVRFLGETVYVAKGVTSLWHWFAQVTLVVTLWFILDALYALWRRGNAEERRRALIYGAPSSVFVLAGVVLSGLAFNGIGDLPHLEFIPFVGLLFAVGYGQSADVLRAARLTEELKSSEASLRESQQQMTMAAEAARLGMWIWDVRTGEMWLTGQCRQIF